MSERGTRVKGAVDDGADDVPDNVTHRIQQTHSHDPVLEKHRHIFFLTSIHIFPVSAILMAPCLDQCSFDCFPSASFLPLALACQATGAWKYMPGKERNWEEGQGISGPEIKTPADEEGRRSSKRKRKGVIHGNDLLCPCLLTIAELKH